MNFAHRCVPRLCGFLIVAFLAVPRLAAEPLSLKRAVELALAHSTAAASANADQQRVFASYREARNQYIPQFILGSGTGKIMGIPVEPGGLRAFDRQPEQPVCGIQSLAAGFCPRRQNGLERGYAAEQRPAQPGDSGHRAELRRAEQVGSAGGTPAGRARRGAPDRATGRRSASRRAWTARSCRARRISARRVYACAWRKRKAPSTSSATGFRT